MVADIHFILLHTYFIGWYSCYR